MNQPLFQQFAEAVKARKCDAFEFNEDGYLFTTVTRVDEDEFALFVQGYGGWRPFLNGQLGESALCHHIREWLTGQGWYWELTDRSLTIAKETFCIYKPNAPRFSEGTQLDWHLQAVVDICAGKATL